MEPTGESELHSALASPVRRRVLDELGRTTATMTAAELAKAVGLHVTTVRFHLEQLENAGLVTRESATQTRRGRPSVHYRATAAPQEEARDHLIRVLAETVAVAGTSAAPDALAAGHLWADLVADGSPDAEAAMLATFRRLGFDPVATGGTIRLQACPFREVARDHPDVVCQVHLGLAQGIAEQCPSECRVHVGLAPFVEPSLCLLTLTPTGSTSTPA